ncbi:MAG: hypothetical protein ACQESR_25855 [Planctomycetota bacterium]
MESCPAQAVLPLVGLAADRLTRDRLIRDRYTPFCSEPIIGSWCDSQRRHALCLIAR